MDRKTTRHCIKFEDKEFIGEANSLASHGYIFIVINRKLMTRTLKDYSLYMASNPCYFIAPKNTNLIRYASIKTFAMHFT